MKLLRERMAAVKNRVCLIDNGKHTYKDLLNKWDEWDGYMDRNYIDSTVLVWGEYSISSIGLMLSLIEHNKVFVPVSSSVADITQQKRIAEVSTVFDSRERICITTDGQITNPLLKGLDGPGLVLFSSGSTGVPKAALHSVSRLLEKYQKRGKALTSIAFLMFDHIGGFNTVMYHLYNGGTLVVPEKRTPEHVLSTVEAYGVEVLPVTPSFLNIMLVTRAYEDYDLSSLKTITYGTEPMPETTLKTMNRIFPGVKMKQTYGLSEVGILRTKSRGSDSLWMKLGDEDHEVEVRDGVLWIKSAMTMVGYLNAESPFVDGWFCTEDKVEVDGEWYKILGRESDIINVGGEKVYPVEVENVILAVPGVETVVVRGEKNSLLGQIVVCEVKGTATKESIASACMKLDPFKRPMRITFTDRYLYTERGKKIK